MGIPGLEVDYNNVVRDAKRETENPEWEASQHPYAKYKTRFGDEFKIWLAGIWQLLELQEAGFPLEKNDLSLFEWRCVGKIKMLRMEKMKHETFSGVEKNRS